MSVPPDRSAPSGGTADHAAFLAAFRRGLDAGGLPPGLTAPAPDEAERRFAVYRNNVVHGLTQALNRRFPVVARLVGEAFFGAMARVFVAAHPPRSPVLQRYGGAFPDFLRGFPPVAHLPYLADVARLELARGEAYHAADAAPLAPEALRAATQATRLRLHPSLRLLRSDWPVVAIWSANQPGGTGIPEARGPQNALVARDPALRVLLRPLGAAEVACLGALSQDEPLSRAQEAGRRVDEGFDIAPALALLIAHGLIVGLHETPRARLSEAAPGDPYPVTPSDALAGPARRSASAPRTRSAEATPPESSPVTPRGAPAGPAGPFRPSPGGRSAGAAPPEPSAVTSGDAPAGPPGRSGPAPEAVSSLPARDGRRRPIPSSQPQEYPA